jgi:hypothetical protein
MGFSASFVGFTVITPDQSDSCGMGLEDAPADLACLLPGITEALLCHGLSSLSASMLL